jgi:hypothetical protein
VAGYLPRHSLEDSTRICVYCTHSSKEIIYVQYEMYCYLNGTYSSC